MLELVQGRRLGSRGQRAAGDGQTLLLSCGGWLPALGCPAGKLQPAVPGRDQRAQRAQQQSPSLGAGDNHVCDRGSRGAGVGIAQDPHKCTRHIVGLPDCSSRAREGQPERDGWGGGRKCISLALHSLATFCCAC